jgi:hypothetical protein
VEVEMISELGLTLKYAILTVFIASIVLTRLQRTADAEEEACQQINFRTIGKTCTAKKRVTVRSPADANGVHSYCFVAPEQPLRAFSCGSEARYFGQRFYWVCHVEVKGVMWEFDVAQMNPDPVAPTLIEAPSIGDCR